jgi:hypothetical protein
VKISITLTLVFFAFSMSPSSFASDFAQWDKDKLSQATIYHAPSAEVLARRSVIRKSSIERAADELSELVNQMTGVDIPITVVETAKEIPEDKPAFVLGNLAVELGAKPPETEFREDGYVIVPKGSHLLFAGESDRGTSYAVAEFLHDQGVRFYMPGPFGMDVPKRDAISIPKNEIVGVPAFEDRRLWLNGGAANQFNEVAPNLQAWFAEWLMRNRLGEEPRVATGHMWAHVFRSSGITREEAFEKNPDWFVEVNGERNPRHLNLLNDEVVDLFANHYSKALEGEPADTRRVLSLSPDDQVILNQSMEAREWMQLPDPIFTHLPDATDYLIQFNNRVVEKVNEKYPNVRLAFYIYSNYQNAPTNVEMNPNLIPFIAPLNFSRYHALTDASKPNRTLLANIVDRWGSKGGNLGWRDYSFLCPDAMMPFNRLHMTRRDIPWLHERGVRYMSTETVSNWPNLLPEFYLLSRLLWDTSIDQDAALDEFYERFYGPAAAPMRVYTEEISNAFNDLPFSSGNREFVDSVFTPERLTSLQEKIDEAKKAVAGDEVRLHRVKLVETALKQGERFMAMRGAMNRFDYKEARRLDNEILQAWDDDIAFDEHTNTLFVKNAWHRRYFSNHFDTINEWLDGAEVVHVFEDEWPAHLDFTKTGELEGLPGTESQGFNLFSLKTFSRSLAEQGWEKFRGDIWYRQNFPEITVPDGKKLYVLFAGVDRFLKAWVNGVEIGEGSGERSFNPVLLEVPDFESLDDNSLVVRVNNESPTELGVGGIIRPVALIVK